MDLLKKTLLIAFYVSVIAVGIIGFLALRSMRQVPPSVQEASPPEKVTPKADSIADIIYPRDSKALDE